ERSLAMSRGLLRNSACALFSILMLPPLWRLRWRWDVFSIHSPLPKLVCASIQGTVSTEAETPPKRQGNIVHCCAMCMLRMCMPPSLAVHGAKDSTSKVRLVLVCSAQLGKVVL